jgi:DNA polymerase III delta subunit
MIILLYGQGEFFLQKKLNEIIEQIKKKYQNNISLEVFDFKEEELKFEEFKNFFAPSLFRERKIFIVKNSFSLPIFKEKIFLEKETNSKRNQKGNCSKVKKRKFGYRTNGFKSLFRIHKQ